jgi:D-alanyl-lipoteichoic acid acyltransferase DltB (MBOAT superfamily)
MLFTSFEYALFLPLIVLLYWVLPRKARLPMLLVASYGFYMSWIPAFIALILPLSLVNWYYGAFLHKATSNRKLIFGVGIALNLLVLGVFKYANFAIQSAASLVHLATHKTPHWSVDIILPLGISFFTFEFIHYLFEIYRGNKPIDSFVLFALYAAFFPTQIAGPIKRYPDFVAQMMEERKLRLSYFDEGLPLIIIGLGKKLLFADNLATLVQMGFQHGAVGAYSAPELWLFAWAFAFQIYFDFSGYTDIARGSAMLFGYHIPINFNMPYIASNMSNFWHRWHISLSTWLRDYLFIPLGGSRGSNWETNRNLLVTMTLGGLWHGASWNFVVWGIFHGVALIVHREFAAWSKTVPALRKAIDSKVGNLVSIFITFQAVCIGWVFFRVTDIGDCFSIVKKMLLLKPFKTAVEAKSGYLIMSENLPVIVPVTLIMVAALMLLNLPISYANEKGWFRSAPPLLKSAFCAAAVVLVVIFLPDGNQPFIYFQF